MRSLLKLNKLNTLKWELTVGLSLMLVTLMPAAAAGPALTVTAPTDGVVIKGTDVTVTFQATDFNIVKSSVPLSEARKHPEANRPGEGHVHIRLDLQPVVVWERAEPYTLSNVAPGEHELMVELVENDHSSLSPQVMQVIRFKTEAPAMVLPTAGQSPSDPATYLAAVLTLAGVLMAAGGLAWRHSRAQAGSFK